MKKINRIFITGQLGAGKAFLAKTLANKLNYEMIDLDFNLERKIGKEINTILGADGVTSFMNCQFEILKFLTSRDNVIVNTDASIVDSKAIRTLLESEFVLFIDVSIPTQLERMLVNSDSIVEETNLMSLLQTLHQQRDDFYREISDFSINSDDSALDKHIERIIKFISDNFQLEQHVSNTGISNLNTTVFHKLTHKPIDLTSQQASCIELLAAGMSAKQIAREINISHRTVEGHLATAMKITGCSNSKELITLYLS